GIALERLQGWGWADAVHPDDLPGLAQAWKALLVAGTPGEAEARLRRRDGEYRWFLFRADALRDQHGSIVRWYGVNIDIEDRKRAEESLQRKEMFLAEGARISSTGTFSWRVDTNELTFSDELCRIFELDPTMVVTFEQVFSRVHPEDLPMLSERMK